jgi:hypothetical protein
MSAWSRCRARVFTPGRSPAQKPLPASVAECGKRLLAARLGSRQDFLEAGIAPQSVEVRAA